jgi:hypothetical protein
METDWTFYLDPDGSVTAMIVDSDIRSDAEGQEALDEEQELLDSLAAGEYHKAIQMDECAPLSIDSQLVRDERPYMVVTSARFRNVVDLFQCIFDEDDGDGRAEFIPLDGHNRLVITVPVDVYDEVGVSETEAEITTDDVDALPSDALRFVLTDGKFVAAEGFEIDEARRSARPIDFNEEQLEEIVRAGVLVYSLTWTVPAEGLRDRDGVPH